MCVAITYTRVDMAWWLHCWIRSAESQASNPSIAAEAHWVILDQSLSLSPRLGS